MAPIKLQKLEKKTKEPKVNDLLALFCYHFPQYTFAQAKKMPYKRIAQMLEVVRQEQAKMLYNLAVAIAAPHTKEGNKRLLKQLTEIFDK